MTAVPRSSDKGTTSPASRCGGSSHDSPFSPPLHEGDIALSDKSALANSPK